MNLLEVKNLSKSFTIPGSQTLNILENLSMSVEKAESLAILGSSGSGKSTLLSLIAGLDRADKGSILIEGEDLSKMEESELSRFRSQKIGIIFQHFYLVNHLSALENIMLPMQLSHIKNPKDQAMQLLKSVRLEHRAKHYPKELSGGEMQRVAIARALSLNPAILIADEPTGNLDTETAKVVSDLFFHLVKENSMTAIIVTHSRELASCCHRTLILKEGKLQ